MDKILQDGIIEPSSSPCSSPVVLVPKPDHSFWFCVDYRKVNSMIIPDAYPMSILHHIPESLEGASWFTTLGFLSGYWQVEDSKQKTVFITTKGLYQLKKVTYGLRKTAATFQQLMEWVLRGLRGMICFKDIIMYSQNCNQHTKDISSLLNSLL